MTTAGHPLFLSSDTVAVELPPASAERSHDELMWLRPSSLQHAQRGPAGRLAIVIGNHQPDVDSHRPPEIPCKDADTYPYSPSWPP